MLPTGWCFSELGQLATKIGSGATPRGGRESYGQSGTPLIRSLNVHFGGLREEGLAFLDVEQAEALEHVTVHPNDVLLNITGASIGRVCLAPAAMAGARVNQHVCIIRTVPQVLSTYIERFLASPQLQRFILEENYGFTRQALTKAMVENIAVPVPPLAEQRRIVAKLDALTARLARARTELQRVKVLLSMEREGIFTDAFAGNLTQRPTSGAPVAPRGLPGEGIDGRSASLHPIPTNWQWLSLGSISFVSGGLTKNASRAMLALRRSYLRVANVYANELRLEDVAEIGCTEAEFLRTKLEKDDLLVVEGNGSIDQVGRVAIWNDEVPNCSHQNHLIKVRAQEQIAPKYLLFWLLSPSGRQHLERLASSSSGLHTLSISKIAGLPVPVPPHQEQADIVASLEAAFARVSNVEAETVRASALLDRLESALLAKAFRGELVPQDPNDEPASVLLQRIRAQRAAAPQPRRARRAEV
jgi:type I restriction enzyme S subunit